MTHTYFYAAIQCRDERAFQEVRTVGTVLLAPAQQFAELKFVPLTEKLGKKADTSLPKAVLAAWGEEIKDAIQGGSEEAIRWLQSRAQPSEDAVRLSAPSVGMADDLAKELKRLTTELTGYRPTPGSSTSETVIARVLRQHRLSRIFQPAMLRGGEAEWKFHFVAQNRVFHPLDLDQTTPSGLLDAAFRETGRFDEVRRDNPSLSVIAVAPQPDSRARERAIQIYRDHHIRVVPAEDRQVEGALMGWGLIGAGEAK